MSDLQREKEKGMSVWYLKDVLPMRKIIRDKFQTPGFGLAAQLFSVMAKLIIEKLGPEEGEALIKEAVETFGRERGKRIAENVKAQGKDLSFKNWLIYTDVDGGNFPVQPRIDQGDLVADVGACSFITAADKWGLRDYAKLYCKYADYAILEGYNPDVLLKLDTRHDSGQDHCCFRYVMKEENK